MKKFILSMAIMLSFGFYVISQNTGNSSDVLAITPTTSSSSSKKTSNSNKVIPVTPVKNNSSATSQNNQPSVSVATVPKKSGTYNDGEYTGPSVDAYYGNIQVRAIISGGKLVDIQFLNYPRDRNTSVRINERALPILKQEAIRTQSANINAVSGASASSPAFIESLSGALSQAKA